MNLRHCNTTFRIDELYQITLDLFSEEIAESTKHISSPFSNKALFGFYDDKISSPIDALKDGEGQERQDFYELISIMAWSFYGQWIKKLSSISDLQYALSDIDAHEVKRLFINNLQCEEGASLLAKLKRN
jgi:hypothetical protein